MSENGARRRPRVLSPEAKWEIFLEVTSREVTQAEAARRHNVDVSTVIGIRRTVKDAALAALAARPGPAGQGAQLGAGAGPKRGRPVDPGRQVPRDRAGAAAGKSRLGLNGAVPARVPAQAKELIVGLVDDAVRGGAAHIWACSLLGVSDDRAHRWRRRLRDTGALADRPPGGVALHALRPSEIEEILDICEQWGPVDRSHRKLAHRGS